MTRIAAKPSIAMGLLQTQPRLQKRRRETWPLLAAALTSGVLFWACFFPLNCGWLAWLALAPMVHLCAGPTSRGTYISAWLGGLAFGIPAVQWVRHAAPAMVVAWAGLALLLSVGFPLWVACSRLLIHTLRLPLIVAVPMAWTFVEFLRSQIDIGFPWYYLGHTQHDYLPLVQIADLFGASGISLLVMMGNVAVYQLVMTAWRRRHDHAILWRPALMSAGITMALVGTALTYGMLRMAQADFQEGPRLALIQGNLSMEEKDDATATTEVARHYLRLAEQATSLQPDLIVWPETSFPYAWQQVDPSVPFAQAPQDWQQWQQESELMGRDLGTNLKTPTLVGLNTEVWEPARQIKLNSVVLLDKSGQKLARYDKCCTVPFGEYLPWKDTLPFMQYLSPYDFDYSIAAGKALTLFELPGAKPWHFATLICYEDTVPGLARRFLKSAPDGMELDFFVNASNDGWFRCSEEHEQHLVGARFRAIECRRAVARAVNMGISAVIDGNGRVIALPGDSWASSKGVTGIVDARVPIDHRFSLYVWWGDVLPSACGGFCIVALIVATVRHRQAKTTT